MCYRRANKDDCREEQWYFMCCNLRPILNLDIGPIMVQLFVSIVFYFQENYEKIQLSDVY